MDKSNHGAKLKDNSLSKKDCLSQDKQKDITYSNDEQLLTHSLPRVKSSLFFGRNIVSKIKHELHPSPKQYNSVNSSSKIMSTSKDGARTTSPNTHLPCDQLSKLSISSISTPAPPLPKIFECRNAFANMALTTTKKELPIKTASNTNTKNHANPTTDEITSPYYSTTMMPLSSQLSYTSLEESPTIHLPSLSSFPSASSAAHQIKTSKSSRSMHAHGHSKSLCASASNFKKKSNLLSSFPRSSPIKKTPHFPSQNIPTYEISSSILKKQRDIINAKSSSKSLALATKSKKSIHTPSSTNSAAFKLEPTSLTGTEPLGLNNKSNMHMKKCKSISPVSSNMNHSSQTTDNGSLTIRPNHLPVPVKRFTLLDNTLVIRRDMFYHPDQIDPRIFAFYQEETLDSVIYMADSDDDVEGYFSGFPAIRTAIIEKLILGLTPESYSDPDFVFIFLFNLNSFTSPSTVLDLLILRWNIPYPNCFPNKLLEFNFETFVKKKQIPVRLRVCNVLKLWLEEHPHSLNEETRHRIFEFVFKVIRKDMSGPASTLLRTLRGETETKSEDVMFDSEPPKPLHLVHIKIQPEILNIHPEEFARQLTILDSNRFRRIKLHEFLDCGWTKPDKEQRSPGILTMINFFNRISKWVSTNILIQTDLKTRANVLNRFICTAQKCYEYNNFNGVMAILSSLQNSAIHRLYLTWSMLPRRSIELFESLTSLMNSNAGEGNYHLYRKELNCATPPVVPYLGVYLTDLIFLNDGNKNFIDESKTMINFIKMAKITKVLRSILIKQQTPYCLVNVDFIQEFIESGHMLLEEDQYSQSVELEKNLSKSERSTSNLAKLVKKIKVDYKALNIHEN